jgi:hypothetical protein
MKEDVKNNIKASFEANPTINEFFVNENGNCFTKHEPNTTVITREEFEKLSDSPIDGDEGKEGKKKKK